MRDVYTIIRRIESDLPVSLEEIEVVEKHLVECRKSRDRFMSFICYSFLLLAIIMLITKQWW